jgi:hypothetical protein
LTWNIRFEIYFLCFFVGLFICFSKFL